MFCKVCLRDAIQVYKLNCNFINLIEKLTEVKMGVNDIVCSFCLTTLRKFQKFTDAVKEVDIILQQQSVNIENNFDVKKLYNLTLSTTTTISIDSSGSLYETDDCNIKEESNALKLEIVKEEPHQLSEDDNDTDSEYEVPLINIAEIKRENERHMYESMDNSGEILPPIQITCLSNEYEDKAVIQLPLEEVTEQNVITKKNSKGSNKSKTNYKCSNRKNNKVNALSKQKKASESTSLNRSSKIISVPKRLNTTEKPYSCKFCSSTFKRKNNLTSHLRTHTGEKPFFCDVCAHRSNTKNDLTRHIRTHTGEKPYSCNVCSYKFSQKSHLTGHLKTHTGEKPFSCNICSYTSFHKNNLIRHIRTHTGEKPFSCNMCSYRCNNKSHLTTHLRTHTGEKPFSCDICPYKCTQKFFLTSHSRIHTGEKPFSCHICSYTCRTNYILKKHLTTHKP